LNNALLNLPNNGSPYHCCHISSSSLRLLTSCCTFHTRSMSWLKSPHLSHPHDSMHIRPQNTTTHTRHTALPLQSRHLTNVLAPSNSFHIWHASCRDAAPVSPPHECSRSFFLPSHATRHATLPLLSCHLTNLLAPSISFLLGDSDFFHLLALCRGAAACYVMHSDFLLASCRAAAPKPHLSHHVELGATNKNNLVKQTGSVH
jgi:hypothetical protein